MRPTVLSLVLAACVAPEPGAVPAAPVGHADPENPLVPVEEAPVLGVERLDVDGPFYAGAIEHFVAVVDGATPRWSASGGELVTDGDEVWWTLPSELGEHVLELSIETADGTHRHEVRVQTIAVSPSASGVVDPSTTEETGSLCALAIDGSDVPHVVYRADTHDQWWYARFTGGAWVRELIDGPGFGVGWFAANVAPSVLVDGTGVVHVGLVRDNGEVVYAKRTTGGAWTVEVAATNSDVSGGDAVVLLLDGSTPILVDTVDDDNSGFSYARVRVSRKSGSWTSSIQPNPTGGATFSDYLRGAFLAGAGSVRFVFADGAGYLWLGSWTSGGGVAAAVTAFDDYTCCSSSSHGALAPSVVRAGFTGVLTPLSLRWSTNGGTSWNRAAYLPQLGVARGLAHDGTNPRIAVRYDTRLEFLRPDARGYWTYTVATTGVDYGYSAPAALSSDGVLHACYQKADQIWFQ